MINKNFVKISTLALILNVFLNGNNALSAQTVTLSQKNRSTIENIKKSTKAVKKKTSKKTKKNTAKKTKKAIYHNGDLSQNIQISEIFPNPKGKDTKKEWLELHNTGNTSINLGNWEIVLTDTVKNSKPKIQKLSDKININPNAYFILEAENLKLSLPNQNTKVELKDPTGNVIDNLTYQKSEEDLSFARFQIQNSKKIKENTNWLPSTKNRQNQIFHKIQGKILEKPGIPTEKNKNSIKILTKNSEKLTILIPPNINTELTNTLLEKAREASFLVEKTADSNTYSLIDFQLKNSPKPSSSKNKTNENWLYFSLIPIAIGLTFLFKRTFGFHCIKDNLKDISSG